MSSGNVYQVFQSNPITSNQNTDLIYIGSNASGGSGSDAAITFQNFAAQFGAPYTAAALTRTNDTNVTLTLGGTPSTSLLQSVSLTLGWSGTLALTRGGTAASLTASNGGIVYSTASALEILAGTATANQVLLSGSSTSPSWSTATYPATTTINQLLYSSSANTIAGLATTNSAALSTNASGVPTWLALTDGQIVIGSSSGAPAAGTITAGSGITITNGNNSITISASGGSSPWSAGAGTNSALGGGATAASGNNSLAWGNSASASNTSAIAIGPSTSSSGIQSYALGNAAQALGNNSFAIGPSTLATATGAMAIGSAVTASGIRSTVIGYSATVNNQGSFVFADSTQRNNTDSATDQFVCTFSNGYYFYVDTTLSWKIDSNHNIINLKGTADQSYSLQATSTGFSITIGAGVKTLILNPSGTLATGTITMPASPIDGQEIRICSDQTVTALTVQGNSGQTISNAPTTIAAGGGFSYIYNLSGANWYRLY